MTITFDLWNLTTTEYFVVVGVVLDIIGFALINRYGFSLNTFAGYLHEALPDLPAPTPEELEEERRENGPILKRRKIARWGIRLVQLGFLLQLVGVVGF